MTLVWYATPVSDYNSVGFIKIVFCGFHCTSFEDFGWVDPWKKARAQGAGKSNREVVTSRPVTVGLFANAQNDMRFPRFAKIYATRR